MVIAISVTLVMSIVFIYLEPENVNFKDIAILLIGIAGEFIGAKVAEKVSNKDEN
jgi:uncharacterized membrane protein YfcA